MQKMWLLRTIRLQTIRSNSHTCCQDPPVKETSLTLKPTCYVMHHQFNIQQLYALPTLCLCVLYLSENKQ